MKRCAPVLLVAFLPFVACMADSPSPVEVPPHVSASKGKGGGGGDKGGPGGQTVYAYTMVGDISGGGSTASSKSTPLGQNMELSNFTVTLGGPTGLVTECRTGSGVYDDDSFHPDNLDREWVGTVKMWKSGSLSFLGSNGGDTLQFTTEDATGGPVLTAEADGSYTYTYTDARLFFGSNSTNYDAKYRCVNLTMIATPVPE